jgi:DNA-binding transcriptional MerR regulator
MDAEWLELIEEAKELGITIEDIKEWLKEMEK